jgi:hypothetical protein
VTASNAIRTDLIAQAQGYLDALVAHDLAAIATTAGFKATQNTRDVGRSAGQWECVTAFPARQFFVDTQSGQVVIMGAAQFAAELRPFMLRLRLQGRAIAESEAIISRDARGHFADVDQLLHPDVIYEAPVPATRGCSRAELLAVADSYWIALSQSDGSLARFNYRCDRFGNGKKITNNLQTLLSPDGAVHSVASCVTATRPARPTVPECRFPVADVERGVVASIVIVEFSTTPRNPRPDTGAFYMLGVFKIVDAEIRIIDEIHEIMAKRTRSGW